MFYHPTFRFTDVRISLGLEVEVQNLTTVFDVFISAVGHGGIIMVRCGLDSSGSG
jgi:hypothetical protein